MHVSAEAANVTVQLRVTLLPESDRQERAATGGGGAGDDRGDDGGQDADPNQAPGHDPRGSLGTPPFRPCRGRWLGELGPGLVLLRDGRRVRPPKWRQHGAAGIPRLGGIRGACRVLVSWVTERRERLRARSFGLALRRLWRGVVG